MKNSFYSLILVLSLFSCVNPTPRKPVTRKTSSFMSKSVDFNKSLNSSEEMVLKKIIEKDTAHTYIASSSGFWYTYNFKSPKTYSPKFGDQIYYTFEVYDLDGSIIYGKEENGLQSYVVDKQDIVEGLRNGLKLMHEGDSITFLFPSHKMFGFSGDENKIGINQPLVYKVKLNKINKKNESN